jgi:hypothetical protein
MKLNSSNIFCLCIIFILLVIMVMRVSCSNFSNTAVKTIENKEQFKNEEFKKEEFQNKYETDNENKEKNNKENINGSTFLFGNSALENLKDNSQMKDRINCFSAPLWWYPKDSYDPKKFKSKYYPDYFDKNLNYWGNAQERFWDFNSVRSTFTVI